MALELLKFFHGVFIFIFVLITLIVGLIILLKYFTYQHKLYIYVGIAWMGMAVPWLPDAIVFLVLAFNIPISAWYINAEWYFILGTGFIPFFIICWLVAMRDLIYPKQGIKIIIVNFIIGILYEVCFFYLLFTDISQLGTFEGIYETRFGLLISGFVIYALITIIITGLHFSINAQRSDEPESRLKGKFLLIAFITFIIGTILDTGLIIIVTDVIGLTKLLLMSSSIEFYIGYIMPERIKKIFLK
ncbi:MAG: hypothetical protein ACFFAO_04700 [Candidatus Hermodarchaeota archaeon]